MDKKNLYKVLSRYIVGKADWQDIRKLREWLDKSEDNRILLHSITEFWDEKTHFFSKDVEELAKNLEQQIALTSQESSPNSRTKSIRLVARRSKSTLLKVAATLTLLFLVGGALYFSGHLDQVLSRGEITNNLVSTEHATNKGEKLTFQLPDGSLVKLNSNSQLSYPKDFSATARNVQLEGEAFFQITKDSSRPFTIISGDLKTTVVGTSFNINAYPPSDYIKVAVSSGKVVVSSVEGSSKQQKLTLSPDEMAVYTKTSNSIEMSSFDRIEEFSWKNEIIVFRDNNILEIISVLENWYGVTIVLDKKIEVKNDYSGTFNNKSLEEVLKGMSYVFDFDFEIENKTVTIK